MKTRKQNNMYITSKNDNNEIKKQSDIYIKSKNC